MDFTNLDKIFWPKEKFTKGDVIDYYKNISPYILPYLKDRPESLYRQPDGIEGEGFYHKDIDQQAPEWAFTKTIYSKSNNKNVRYLLCQDKKTLLYMANLGCIEINPWLSRVSDLNKPDYAIIDLDPEDISFNSVVETALTIHKLLDKIGADNFIKTSGATGLHIMIPLGAKYTYKEAKIFTELIANITHAQLPKTTSIIRDPKRRKNKVYLDFLQNRKGQTITAPYSLRGRLGIPVSTPLKWTEVKIGLDPKNYNVKNIFPRLNKIGDIFKPVLGKGIDLKKCLAKLEKM